MNEFLDMNNNTSFSKLRGLDLMDLVNTIEKFYLTYRELLNIPLNVTFGVEIEVENLPSSEREGIISDDWYFDYDATVSSGGEFVSPIMYNEKRYWQQLKEVCINLKNKNVDTLHNAGGHIHIGTPILGNNLDKWRGFLKTYMVYENVFFRFAYGDKLVYRDKIETYAKPIASLLYNSLEEINEASDLDELLFDLTDTRRQAVNFLNVDFSAPNVNLEKNTIEFRAYNGTIEEVIWQNNINCCIHMLLSSYNKLYDEDYLNYKIEHNNKNFNNLYIYNEINLKDALEFVDIVFNNNLDKVYFLRQYVKDGNVSNNSLVKSREFTRR